MIQLVINSQMNMEYCFLNSDEQRVPLVTCIGDLAGPKAELEHGNIIELDRIFLMASKQTHSTT